MSNKIIKCKVCGADIAKSAKSCPSCGAKNKKRTGLAVVAIIFGVLLLASVFGETDSGPKRVDSENGEENQPIASQEPDAVPEQTVFGVGEQVDLNGVYVTLSDVSENAGSSFNKPSGENTFLVCSFDIENNSEKDITVSSLMSFEAYVDDYSTSLSITATISTDKTQLDGTVAAGKKMSGVIGYEIPKDWKELEIYFTPDFWSGKEITFIASNS